MRDGQAPRGFGGGVDQDPGLPGGTEERFAGYGVMRLPFRSGHYLALRHFPASSIGPGFRAVRHRDPHRRWTFYADALAEVSCARYFGATSPGGAERVPIDVTWTGPRSLRVRVPDVLAWEVHLAATAATRLLSSASRLLPDRSWDSDRVLGAMGRVAGLLLRAGRVRLHGNRPQRPTLPGRPTTGLGGHQQHRAGWRSRHRSAGPAAAPGPPRRLLAAAARPVRRRDGPLRHLRPNPPPPRHAGGNHLADALATWAGARATWAPPSPRARTA